MAKQLAVDLLLEPGPILLGRAEVLERAETGHRIEGAEGIPRDFASVTEASVQPMSPARGGLRRGECDAHGARPALTGESEQRPPPTAQVGQPAPGPQPDLLGH